MTHTDIYIYIITCMYNHMYIYIYFDFTYMWFYIYIVGTSWIYSPKKDHIIWGCLKMEGSPLLYSKFKAEKDDKPWNGIGLQILKLRHPPNGTPKYTIQLYYYIYVLFELCNIPPPWRDELHGPEMIWIKIRGRGRAAFGKVYAVRSSSGQWVIGDIGGCCIARKASLKCEHLFWHEIQQEWHSNRTFSLWSRSWHNVWGLPNQLKPQITV